MRFLTAVFGLVRETAVGYSQGKGSTLAAAIAFRALFSIAPLLVIAVAVAGWVFGDRAVAGELVAQLEGVVGGETAVLIQDLIRNTRQSSSGTIATVVSVILLFLGASSLFGQIKIALNQIWGVTPVPTEEGVKGLFAVVWSRLLAVLMVILIGLFLLLMISISAALAALEPYLADWWAGSGGFISVLDDFLLVSVTAVLLAIVFKILPDAAVAWRDVGLGALVTAVLFGVGEYLIGLYLTRASISSTYGAAGSLVLTLLWVYYSAQIFLFGAEFTQAYANRYGSRVRGVERETE